ncbi:hypothetical protein ABT390_08225 [Streptomyces aurantiacus]|uniref:hypothetical protein n=1 Tax=Streptomyces aurantiacus TaxID=47760 RepID=UPI000416C00D|nr:hypothetical protein [Streptomyces aurantiacus]
MRRVTVHKTVVKSAARRARESREALEGREGADRRARERPEVRRDVQRVWWPTE